MSSPTSDCSPTSESPATMQPLTPLPSPPPVDNTSPLSYVSPIAPVASPPSPTTPLLPVAASPTNYILPVASPPPPVTPIPLPPPPIASPILPPPVPLPRPPTVATLPPSTTFISPMTSPHPPPEPPIPPITSSPPPKSALPPPTSPPPPTTQSPPPLATPLIPSISPPPPATSAPRDHPLPPTRPIDSPPQPFAFPPPPPSSSLASPLSSGSMLPSQSSVNGNLPATSQVPMPQALDMSTGLIVGCVIGGVLLLLVTCLLFFCYKEKRRRDWDATGYCVPHCLGPKDNFYAVLPQHLQQNAPPQGAHIITVLTKPLPPPPPTNGSRGSSSMNSRSENPLPPQAPGVAAAFSGGIFTYDELVVATNGFSEANLLGQGGFGYVHKGVLPNGKEVAVKQLKTGSRQGEREFQAEVETVSRVHHKHLVSLVGYCITGAERLLVYEFVPNNTLEFHLHANGWPIMKWATRLKIAIGSAKGLAYLHEDCNPTIIHRDIKTANILLDFKFEAKVSDFGLAKSFSDANSGITHISTRVVGTFGYLAPEYASSGKVTGKSDVYSYGVMLLELITGHPPIDTAESLRNEGLVNWARPLLAQALEDGNYDTLVDPRLQGKYITSEMASMVTCAAACVRHSAWLRPRMSQIVRALEGDVSLIELDGGNRPGHITLYSSSESSNYDTHKYNDRKKFNMALASHEYGVSRYSGSTSEYGLNPSITSSEASNNLRNRW